MNEFEDAILSDCCTHPSIEGASRKGAEVHANALLHGQVCLRWGLSRSLYRGEDTNTFWKAECMHMCDQRIL